MWTQEEDQKLLDLYTHFGNCWRKIAQFIPGKKSKQIRQRYTNSLDPCINYNCFTQDEDQKIIDQYKIHGSKWETIAKLMQGRTQNQIKNRFNSHIKRFKLIDTENMNSQKQEDDSETSSSEESSSSESSQNNIQQKIQSDEYFINDNQEKQINAKMKEEHASIDQSSNLPQMTFEGLQFRDPSIYNMSYDFKQKDFKQSLQIKKQSKQSLNESVQNFVTQEIPIISTGIKSDGSFFGVPLSNSFKNPFDSFEDKILYKQVPYFNQICQMTDNLLLQRYLINQYLFNSGQIEVKQEVNSNQQTIQSLQNLIKSTN